MIENETEMSRIFAIFVFFLVFHEHEFVFHWWSCHIVQTI